MIPRLTPRKSRRRSALGVSELENVVASSLVLEKPSNAVTDNHASESASASASANAGSKQHRRSFHEMRHMPSVPVPSRQAPSLLEDNPFFYRQLVGSSSTTQHTTCASTTSTSDSNTEYFLGGPRMTMPPLSSSTHATNALHAPLSPSPTPAHPLALTGTNSNDDAYKSPVAQDVSWSDGSNSSSPWSNCSVTPPVTGPRPLVVSAKRLGQDVRRRRSKRRRFRSKNKNPSSDQNDGSQCLWKDSSSRQPPVDHSSSEEESEERLPFLFAPGDVPPPLHQQRQYYWDYCYGNSSIKNKNNPTTLTPPATLPTPPSTKPGWSASRAPPTKGCLSIRKKKKEVSLHQRFATPPSTPEEEEEERVHPNKAKKNNRVQFGSPQAAEYEVDGPTAQLTPLPSEVIRKRYSMDTKQPTQEEEEMTTETKQNSAVLATWEDDFDEPRSSSSRRRRRKNRRDSALFTPSPMALEQDSPEDQRAQISPSVIVMENLASLSVASPTETQTATIDTTSPSPVSNSQSHSSSSSLNYSLSDSSASTALVTSEQTSAATDSSFDEGVTAQFAVDLNTVNAQGGAMDTTPTRLQGEAKPDTTSSVGSSDRDTTPSPTDVSLETIHSVGGALDHTSPPAIHVTSTNSSGGSGLSPISRLSETSISSSMEGESLPSETTPIDIVQLLLNQPSADQEWPMADLLRNLVVPPKKRVVGLLRQLQSHPQLEKSIRSCLQDFCEQVDFQASATKLSAAEDQSTVVAKEWKQLELDFLEELTTVLKKHKGETGQNLQRVLDLVSKAPTKRVQERTLKAEIQRLSDQIQETKELQSTYEAAAAPRSSLLCQALSQIGVCGFRLDEFQGDSLHFTYEHAMEGVESQFAYMLSTNQWTASYATDTTGPTTVAASFHREVLQHIMMNGDEKPLLIQRAESMKLHSALLAMSECLTRVDLVAMDLLALANQGHKLRVQWPCLTVKNNINEGWWLELEYKDAELLANGCLPSSVWMSPNMGTLPVTLNQAVNQDPRGSSHQYIQRMIQGVYEAKHK